MFKVTKKVILKSNPDACMSQGTTSITGKCKKKKSLGFIKNKSKQQQISKITYQNKNKKIQSKMHSTNYNCVSWYIS